jgi:hypothetical protein
VISLIVNKRQQPNRAPCAVIAPAARVASFRAFFRSGLQKLATWSARLAVFKNEYHVPRLQFHVAVHGAASLTLCISNIMDGSASRPIRIKST